MTEQKRTLTLTALAKYTGIHKRKLYRMIADKSFPVEPIKGVKPRLWNVEAVNQWLKGQE